MKIVGVDLHILLAPDYDAGACSSAQDDLVVEVRTDEGITGVGETDTNPWVARECIRARGTHCMGLGLKEMLLGADPMQPEAVWNTLYGGSKMTGRRGALICAMGAIDMALWDVKGQALGVPVASLLGGDPSKPVVPYASLLPTGTTLDAYRDSLVDKATRAKALGFRALIDFSLAIGAGRARLPPSLFSRRGSAGASPSRKPVSLLTLENKLEACINGPYSHHGLQESDDEAVEIVAACRRAVGPDVVLMVDVAYAWPDARTALGVIERLAPYNLYYLETPIDVDDLEGHACLHDHSPIPIAAGEWQDTHFEFLDLADRGKVDVLQPDVGRVGGFTEAVKVARIASERGLLMVPHCWKSGIGIAASAHLAAGSDCCPYIEFLPMELADSPLRRELLTEDLAVTNGAITLPRKPGLGITLNRDALQKYRVEE